MVGITMVVEGTRLTKEWPESVGLGRRSEHLQLNYERRTCISRQKLSPATVVDVIASRAAEGGAEGHRRKTQFIIFAMARLIIARISWH